MTIDPAYLVGLTEIAERAQVTRAAVTNWQSRWPDFPTPVVRLAMGPVFDWRQIETWLRTPHAQHMPGYTRKGYPVRPHDRTIAARL